MHGDEDELGVEAVGSQAAHRVQSAHDRHIDVGDDDVWPEAMGAFEELHASVHRGEQVAGPLEQAAQSFATIGWSSASSTLGRIRKSNIWMRG